MWKIVSNWLRQLWWILPFLTIGVLFGLFLSDRIPGLPADLSERGQFGDSFGVLNSLFTGLGFAGLLVTIGLQQRQIRQQARDFQAQLQDTAARRYEDNLFRLLALYHEVVNSIISTREGQTTKGRDVLRLATEGVLKNIRQDGVNSIPHEIQKRYRAQTLTNQDRDALEFLYYKNFTHLNYGLIRQGRLIESLKALLRHLEDEAPASVQRDTYRSIVVSQITHVEVSYFLFVALGFSDESELRDLLIRSSLIKRASNVYKLQVHRYMYLDYWNYDLNRNKQARPLPISRARIKELDRQEKAIRAVLRQGVVTNTESKTPTLSANHNVDTNDFSEPPSAVAELQH